MFHLAKARLLRLILLWQAVLLAPLCCAQASPPQQQQPQLLFYVSAKESLTADIAGGDAAPNFVDHIGRSQTGVVNSAGDTGWAIDWADEGVLSWNAPGNIYAQRGTLSFFWRAATR